MIQKLDIKMTAYTLGVSLLFGFLREYFHPALPDTIGLTVGFILFLASMVIAGMEIKKNLGMFYAYAENWNGGFFNNSALILGVSNFFFTSRYAFYITANVLSAIYLVARIILRKSLQRESDN
ncbi:hypothetical protein [Aedoeadaptatus coxii]|uniref:Uncharacterized protein n=1 Tax=Aedoeadaptatus coxii TaxID=755172 RepID=A0A134AH20_9FIRM|nr:hypothetical protein [Peptoniphilus coxii]KXB67023.1 hypothetical protein HMPREF1863_00749 [Peptoniphilus coxii]